MRGALIRPVFLCFHEMSLKVTEFFQEFKRVMFENGRFDFIIDGLKNTFLITLGSLILGIALGVIVAVVRSTYDKNHSHLKKTGGFSYYLFSFFNAICQLYLTVIRGTPVVVQLMIFYFVIFASTDNGVLVATLAFGINSGAYVAEIFRSGIMAVDNGQFEAGRSLGLNYAQTMWHIVIPQAFKNILPALGNEMITLLKDTSLVSVISLRDITKQAQNIANKTYQAFIPYISLALIYLVIVIIMTKLLSVLERRLRKGDH